MVKRRTPVFSPDMPPDLEHASSIREEAFDWLDSHHAGVRTFTPGNVLGMAGERERRWLIGRLRQKGIGNEELFSMPAAADALAVLFLRSKGVRFREAVNAVVGGKEAERSAEPRYGGVWNRLIDFALQRLRRQVSARLLGSAVFGLLRDPSDQANCLIIVKRHGQQADAHTSEQADPISHEYAFRTILDRPAPSCWVLSPSREVLFLDQDQLPTRAEVTARHFVGLHVATEHEVYELLLGTMRPASVSEDDMTLQLVGRLLDIAYPDFEEFLRSQASQRFEAVAVPDLSDSDDLQLWLMTQFLAVIYPGSLCEVSETYESSQMGRVLASSVARPWEPSLWDPPRTLEMLSGYASRVGVPLVVERVEQPWTSMIESVEPEMRYLESRSSSDDVSPGFSAMALPITVSSGDSIGALYALMPRVDSQRLDVEVRVLSLFGRIVGEIVERQRAAIHTANVSANIASLAVLQRDQFKTALLELLTRQAEGLGDMEQLQRDVRLPFLLLSAHVPDPDELDPVVSDRLRHWLVETLRHLEWRSFVRTHLSGGPEDDGAAGFMGELPGVGMMIALGRLVTKDELDRIRNAFPTTINRTSPTNAPVKLVAWVLDVPSRRILDAAKGQDLSGLADDIESWAFDVATVVDDVAQSVVLAHENGEWDTALRRVRRALRKEGGRKNGYLYRLAAECSFSLGDWPSALRYAKEGATLSRQELGSGFVRSRCQEADAHLCLCNPVRAWDLYTAAATEAPSHPLPRYYRGQALMLIAKLLHEFENERLRAGSLEAEDSGKIDAALNTLVDGALDDLSSAADLLDRWGLIPESYQYRNFHLVPALIGQGASYLLSRLPGPAASRLQSARRSFPKDDLFLREFLFAKCWEQGLHLRYGKLLLGDEWAPLSDRLHEAFGEPQNSHRATVGYTLGI